MSFWSTTISKGVIVAVAVSFAASGCTLPTTDDPDFQLTALALPERLSSVTLCVTNPNTDTLVFRRVTVTLDRSSAPLAIGSSDAAFVVPALSTTRMPIAVLATRQGGSVRASDVSYRVDGSVGLDHAFGLTIPYHHVGRLNFVSSTASSMLSHCAGADITVPL